MNMFWILIELNGACNSEVWQCHIIGGFIRTYPNRMITLMMKVQMTWRVMITKRLLSCTGCFEASLSPRVYGIRGVSSWVKAFVWPLASVPLDAVSWPCAVGWGTLVVEYQNELRCGRLTASKFWVSYSVSFKLNEHSKRDWYPAVVWSQVL